MDKLKLLLETIKTQVTAAEAVLVTATTKEKFPYSASRNIRAVMQEVKKIAQEVRVVCTELRKK